MTGNITRRVEHPEWGEGIIRPELHGMFCGRVFVEFANRVNRWVPRAELQVLD